MSDIRDFKVNDWIITEDGICQVLDSQKYYVEPFLSDELNNYELGEVFENKVVFKIFCDFTGKIRKTQYIKWHSSQFCEPINNQYLTIKNKAKEENPDKYVKFLERTLDKPVYSKIELSIRVVPEKREEIIQNINELLNNIKKPFNYYEFEGSILKDIKGIISPKLINNDNLETNVMISLKYDVLKNKDGKFSFVSGIAVPTYSGKNEL